MQKRFKILIKGYVQGVGYRYFCYRKAIEYNLNGYAKNLINGSVEVETEGEETMIKEFINELRIGPRNSKVNSINIEELPFENKYEDFRIY
ncbi:MAG: acylphosphatase [Bacteroidota bacterium]|nr:acylphosphatase [Bacteroidota bacterium]